MSVQSRQIKVLTAFLTSLTAGAIILMALGNDPPPAGAFCLSDYYPVRDLPLEVRQPLGQEQPLVVLLTADPTTKGSNGTRLTDLQVKRTNALVEALRRDFNIPPDSIYYPNDWQGTVIDY